MKKIVLKISLIIVFLISGNIIARDDIEYTNKRITKEIIKTLGIDAFNLEEIVFDDNTVQGKFFKILDSDNNIAYTYIGRVNSCRSGGCSPFNNQHSSFEYFDYLFVLDTTFTVKKVKVFNYQATHGQEICSKNWLKQFINYNGEKNLVVGKNIDAIAGATISTHSITFDIQDKTLLLKELLGEYAIIQ